MSDIPWLSEGFSSRKLQYLLKENGIDPGTAHRAESDAKASVELLMKQINGKL